MTEIETIQNEIIELQQRLFTAQHEGFMRDMEQARRTSTLEKDLSELTVKVKEVAEAVGQCADLYVRLSARMDQTDKRWNQLIDLLSKEHGNGGKP